MHKRVEQSFGRDPCRSDNNRPVTGFAPVYEHSHATWVPVYPAGRNAENAAQRHLFGQVIWMKMEILLIGTCALVHALIRATATGYVDNDRGAGYARGPIEVVSCSTAGC